MSGSTGSLAPGDRSDSKAATKTEVVIGNLKRDVDEEALKALLRQLGRVTSFALKQPPGIDPASPATGIVEYASAEDAARVVAHVHGKLILGRPVTAWVPALGGSAPPLPQGAPEATSGTRTPAGPGRPAYLGEMDRRNAHPPQENNGVRYAPPGGQPARHEDPRWERGPGPQHVHRVAERGSQPPETYGEAYPHSQRLQHQHQQPWQPRRITAQQHSGTNAALRFRGEGDPAHYSESEWQDSGNGEGDEPWERQERSHYPPAHRAPIRREHAAAYHHPEGPHTSRWYDETDAHVAPAPHAGYGNGGQRQPPSGRVMMPRDASGGPARVTPRGGDEGYDDEGIGNRRRPPPLSGAARGMELSGRGTAWTADAEYALPPPLTIKGEDFEKEVVKAAALLVAEREMRARDEARKKGVTNETRPDGESPPGNRDREESKRKGSSSKARRGSRSAAGETDKRKKEESTHRSEYRDGKSNDRPRKKRTRRDGSPQAGSLSPNRSDNQHASDGKRAERTRGAPKTREHCRDEHGEGSRGRNHDQHTRSGGRRDKGIESSTSRTPKPGSSAWESSGGASSPMNDIGDKGFYVHVGGLSFTTTFTTLAKRFAAFGDVNGFKVIFNKVSCTAADTGTRKGSTEEGAKAAVVTASSGFAFVSFDDERGMEKAVEGMDGQKLDGHILKVTRGGRLQGKALAGVKAFRAHQDAASPTFHPRGRWPESRGKQEYEQQFQQPRKPQPRPEIWQQYQQPHRPQPRSGDRREAPIGSAASSAGFSTRRDTGSSRRAGGGGGGHAGRDGGENVRVPSPDPLGALRSPRPSASSRKDAPAVKPEANGRPKVGYGGSSTRDAADGVGNGDGTSFRKAKKETSGAPPKNTSCEQRMEKRLGPARPTNAAHSASKTAAPGRR